MVHIPRSLGQIVIIIITATAQIGCALRTPIPPTAQELQFGRNAVKPPSKEVARQAVRAFLSRDLKDPYSSKFVFLELKNSYFIEPRGSGTRKFGWFLCGVVNARNSYGAYVGNRMFMAYFDPKDGTRVIDGAIEGPEYNIVGGWCSDIYKETPRPTEK